MKHLDAKAIRERLNTVQMALTTLEHCSTHHNHRRLATAGQRALREIAVLVTDDELEEHQAVPIGELRRERHRIRSATANGGDHHH